MKPIGCGTIFSLIILWTDSDGNIEQQAFQINFQRNCKDLLETCLKIIELKKVSSSIFVGWN